MNSKENISLRVRCLIQAIIRFTNIQMIQVRVETPTTLTTPTTTTTTSASSTKRLLSTDDKPASKVVKLEPVEPRGNISLSPYEPAKPSCPVQDNKARPYLLCQITSLDRFPTALIPNKFLDRQVFWKRRLYLFARFEPWVRSMNTLCNWTINFINHLYRVRQWSCDNFSELLLVIAKIFALKAWKWTFSIF